MGADSAKNRREESAHIYKRREHQSRRMQRSSVGPPRGCELVWRQEWQADNAGGIEEAFRKTMEHREAAFANAEAAAETEDMLTDTAGKIRQAAKKTKPSTARRLDGFSFKDSALVQGKPAEELASITQKCLRSLALPAQELRHEGALLPKKDGKKG